MKRAAKRDNEEEAIVCALMIAGVRVQRLSDPGVPDLLAWTPLAGFRLLEVKSRHGTLTPAQQRFANIPYTVVRSAEEALALFREQRERADSALPPSGADDLTERHPMKLSVPSGRRQTPIDGTPVERTAFDAGYQAGVQEARARVFTELEGLVQRYRYPPDALVNVGERIGYVPISELDKMTHRGMATPGEHVHIWTPDETKNRCSICGDGPWGRHRFHNHDVMILRSDTP